MFFNNNNKTQVKNFFGSDHQWQLGSLRITAWSSNFVIIFRNFDSFWFRKKKYHNLACGPQAYLPVIPGFPSSCGHALKSTFGELLNELGQRTQYLKLKFILRTKWKNFLLRTFGTVLCLFLWTWYKPWCGRHKSAPQNLWIVRRIKPLLPRCWNLIF